MKLTPFPQMDIHKQTLIQKKKEALRRGILMPEQYPKSSLISEWHTSMVYGIDPHMPALDDSHLNPNTLTNIKTYLKAYKTYYADFFEFQSRALTSHGCAVFYLDEELSVYHKDGSPELLEHLKDLGIKFSTNFSEAVIGVNAASIASNSPKTVVRRYGQENYLDLFTSYILYAKSVESPITAQSTILMIVPMDNFNPYIEELISHLYEMEDILSSKVNTPMEEARTQLLKKAAVVGEDEMLVCNKDGNVVFINENLEAFTGMPDVFCEGRHLSNVFPSLTFCLRCLNTKQNIPLHETYIRDVHGESHSYYAECFVIKSGNIVEGIKIILKKASKIQNYVSEVTKQTTAQHSFGDMKGNSVAFQKVIQTAQKAANTHSNVLIFGESGTGKELMAQSIHNASSRKNKPFVPLNCGAIPKDLIASELFGYEEGAFTGAKKGGHIGKLEQANGGTLFLDEIGEMPFDMQATLLRFLEDGVIYRLGGKKPIPLNVRIISATNRNLPDHIEAGKFRLDLYYRLNVIKLTMPPLRDRTGDIPILVEALLKKLNHTHGTPKVALTPNVIQLLEAYNWPGNLRELRNILEYIASTAELNIVDVHDLPDDVLRTLQPMGASPPVLPPQSTSQFIASPIPAPQRDPRAAYDSYDEYEQERIFELMVKYNGNKSLVAKELGIARSTLYRKLKNN